MHLFQVSELMGGLFQRTELSETLTEIIQLDPTFNKDRFLLECEKDIIPNILEAMCRGELEVCRKLSYNSNSKYVFRLLICVTNYIGNIFIRFSLTGLTKRHFL